MRRYASETTVSPEQSKSEKSLASAFHRLTLMLERLTPEQRARLVRALVVLYLEKETP